MAVREGYTPLGWHGEKWLWAQKGEEIVVFCDEEEECMAIYNKEEE
jgi:hypothetical protein